MKTEIRPRLARCETLLLALALACGKTEMSNNGTGATAGSTTGSSGELGGSADEAGVTGGKGSSGGATDGGAVGGGSGGATDGAAVAESSGGATDGGAVAGSSGGATDGAAAGGGSATNCDDGLEPSVDGRWLLVGFDDPVGIDFVQRGCGLAGVMCLAGLPPVAHDSDCAPLAGQRQGRNLVFQFSPPPRPDAYSGFTEVTISEDGERMTGSFTGYKRIAPTAWLRVQGEGYPPLPDRDPLTRTTYELEYQPSDDTPAEALGQELGLFEAGVVYRISWDERGTVWGDLGAFWATEVSYEFTPEGSVASFVAGPVVATSEHAAARVALSVLSDSSAEVVMNTHSGARFVFVGSR